MVLRLLQSQAGLGVSALSIPISGTASGLFPLEHVIDTLVAATALVSTLVATVDLLKILPTNLHELWNALLER